MPRRRLLLVGALVAVLVPAIGFGVTRFALDTDAAGPVAATRSATSTTEEPTTTTDATTTTSTTPPTTATTLPAGNPATSPLPSIPRPGEPVAASTNEGLADQIRNAEAAIADPATGPDELRRQAHVQQVAYRALVNAPDRKAAVLALLTPQLQAVAEANVTAGGKLRSMITKPRTSLPPWRIVPPAPVDELLGYYRAAEAEFGVPWYHLAAIHLVETRMGRIRGNSEANAQGPMQFLPATWAQYGNGGDIQSNKDAIAAAARYLKRNGAPGDMRNAVWNYNHDFRYVDAVLAYGERMKADERAYHGYHQWQVYYVTTVGDVWLPEGYSAS
ncbi:MAG TPA: lytic transglycosylase domain-containing protein [Acidimicrobiales bacterium]|nr:lytic transglycosylase domain-containing protein [Acidimicrobiales bacterium]